MLTSLEIQNFRSIRSLKMEGFSRINILAGRNGCGKSTVLEAVELLLHPDPLLPARQIQRRRLPIFPSRNIGDRPAVVRPWENLFPGADSSQSHIDLRGTWNGELRSQNLTTRASDSPLFNDLYFSSTAISPVQQWRDVGQLLDIESREKPGVSSKALVYPGPDGEWTWIGEHSQKVAVASVWAQDNLITSMSESYGKLQLEGREEFVIEALKQIVPDLQQLDTIVINGKPELYAKFASRQRIPALLLGDGVVRVLIMLCAGLGLKSGVWLIDEVENGVHYSSMPLLWLQLAKAAEIADAQLFCTTHSREAVLVAQDVLSQDQLQFFRIDRRREEHVAVNYHPEDLATASEMNFEFR